MILCAGHRGFIGSAVVRELDAQCIPWRGLDLLEYGDIADVTFKSVEYDAIINCAGVAGAPQSNDEPERYYRNNAYAAAALFREARRAGIPVVHCSSAMADDETTHYAIGKKAAERAAALEVRLGADIALVRIHNVYGPGQPENFVVPTFLKRIAAGETVYLDNGGRALKDFIYVDDVARALVTAATYGPPLRAGLFHAATGILTPVADLFALAEEAVGNGAGIEEREDPQRAGETCPIPELSYWYGAWQARVSLREGLELTWKALQAGR